MFFPLRAGQMVSLPKGSSPPMTNVEKLRSATPVAIMPGFGWSCSHRMWRCVRSQQASQQ
jgi:hypothetical protein